MILLYLLLAHLLADFVFQSNKLITWKKKDWKGVFMHVFIHWVTSLLLLFPFLSKPQFPIVVTVIALSHFIIDSLKIRFEKEDKRYVKIFLADQELHLIVIVLGAFVLEEFGGAETAKSQIPVYANVGMMIYWIFSVVVTFFYSILKFQFHRQREQDTHMEFDYVAMLIRFIAFSIVYFFLLSRIG